MLERLLLVEDRENLRAVLARVLGGRFDVDAVGDGADAIARLNDHAYAVVITDMRLPGAPGTEVLAVARGLDSPPEVIVVTGYAEVPAAVAALPRYQIFHHALSATGADITNPVSLPF